MVLDVEMHDASGHRGGEQGERIGRVPREDDDVVGARAAQLGDDLTRPLVGRRADP